jgi:hypothetical protein
MTDDPAAFDRSPRGKAGPAADRAVAREALEQETTPDAVALGSDSLPPGHPAQADDTFSSGELLSRDEPLPGEAGRPGRTGDVDPAA